jgi:hypothetical protein
VIIKSDPNRSCKAVDFAADRLETAMLPMGTFDCVASPVTMADAIVPQPIKPRRTGAGAIVLGDDADKEADKVLDDEGEDMLFSMPKWNADTGDATTTRQKSRCRACFIID